MSELTIGQAAQLLGISKRTLRHWDEIGLLQPSFRSWGDYRLYTEDDLDVALEILVYRETGMPLKEIAEIVNGGESSLVRLRNQQQHLKQQLARLRQMHDAVTTILERDLTMTEKIQAMGTSWAEYAEEAEARWGDTPEWEQSQEKQQAMTAGDWAKAKEEMESFAIALAAAEDAGVAPGTAEAKKLVYRHRTQVAQWYECTAEKQVCLARMFLADERFHAAYAGRQEFLLRIVEKQAELEGVDLSAVEWR
ncbi:MerR family transcriptional regulator [Corynebacterium sp. H128]|uniref:MerR family transcriptional regulator n=1 Tax=unclassified Corynebacterium TaxID=2624378 RepID=UPI003094E61D